MCNGSISKIIYNSITEREEKKEEEDNFFYILKLFYLI